jgi:hypothetical protein
MEKFKGGRTSVVDVCSGRPPTVRYVGVKEEAYERVRDNRIINIDEIVP